MSKQNLKVKIPDIEWFRENIPCQARCPAHTDISGYVGLIAQGRFEEAYTLNRQANLFPEILGRICARPCESACRLGRISQPVSICSLKRAAADFGGKKEMKRQEPTRSEKIAIIGAGPAGLAAAHDLAILGYRVHVFEALPDVGGMLVVGIPAYRLPREIVKDAARELEDMGVVFHMNTPVGRDIHLSDLRRDYSAVLIAAGAHKPEKLGIPGEDLQGVLHGVTFMRQVNTDPNLRLDGRRVAVIGGGHTAIDCVRSAARLGAAEVHMLYRRSGSEMTVTEEEIYEAEEEGVKIQYLVSPTMVYSHDGRTVSGLKCQRNELGEPDVTGRRRPVPIPGSEFVLDIDMLIPAVSQAPDSSFLPPEAGLEMSQWDRLLVHPSTLMSNVAGVFAVGDFITGPRNVIEVIADGRKAAASIDRYVNGGAPTQRKATLQKPGRPFDRDPDYDRIPKQRMRTLPLQMRGSLEREVELGYTAAQAMAEASRCLQCQMNVTINGDLCILCGGCIDVCPQGLIRMAPLASVVSDDGLEDLLEEGLIEPGTMAMVLDEEKCIRCGLCVQRCSTKAVSMAQFQLEDKDERWYVSLWREGDPIGLHLAGQASTRGNGATRR